MKRSRVRWFISPGTQCHSATPWRCPKAPTPRPSARSIAATAATHHGFLKRACPLPMQTPLPLRFGHGATRQMQHRSFTEESVYRVQISALLSDWATGSRATHATSTWGVDRSTCVTWRPFKSSHAHALKTPSAITPKRIAYRLRIERVLRY